MRWEDERYVRVYTRETTTMLMLPWQSRTVLGEMFKKCDRAGFIDLGEDGYDGLAAVLRLPIEIIEAGMPDLLRRKVVRRRDEGTPSDSVFIPNFIAAQEAKHSDKARQRASRERARDKALRGIGPDGEPTRAGEQTVTPRDMDDDPRDIDVDHNYVTSRDVSDRLVTVGHETVGRCHEPSRAVTLCCAVLNTTTTGTERPRSVAPSAAPSDPTSGVMPVAPTTPARRRDLGTRRSEAGDLQMAFSDGYRETFGSPFTFDRDLAEVQRFDDAVDDNALRERFVWARAAGRAYGAHIAEMSDRDRTFWPKGTKGVLEWLRGGGMRGWTSPTGRPGPPPARASAPAPPNDAEVQAGADALLESLAPPQVRHG